MLQLNLVLIICLRLGEDVLVDLPLNLLGLQAINLIVMVVHVYSHLVPHNNLLNLVLDIKLKCIESILPLVGWFKLKDIGAIVLLYYNWAHIFW